MEFIEIDTWDTRINKRPEKTFVWMITTAKPRVLPQTHTQSYLEHVI